MVIFEEVATGLAYAHGFLGMVGLAVLAYAIWLQLSMHQTEEFGASKLERMMSIAGAVLIIVTLITGSMVYPAFRVNVRAAYMDEGMPWATGIFEIKEFLASVALFVYIGLMFIAAFTDYSKEGERPKFRIYTALSILGFILVALKLVLGLYLVAIAPV
jgi:cytochrome bd-type quinol oxidase subunit 2